MNQFYEIVTNFQFQEDEYEEKIRRLTNRG